MTRAGPRRLWRAPRLLPKPECSKNVASAEAHGQAGQQAVIGGSQQQAMGQGCLLASPGGSEPFACLLSAATLHAHTSTAPQGCDIVQGHRPGHQFSEGGGTHGRHPRLSECRAVPERRRLAVPQMALGGHQQPLLLRLDATHHMMALSWRRAPSQLQAVDGRRSGPAQQRRKW